MIATTNFALHNLWSINDVVAEIRHLQLYYVYSCFLEKSVLQKADTGDPRLVRIHLVRSPK